MAATSAQASTATQPLKGWAAFEHRVAQSAEYLLILTFVVIFWMAGFVDLFTHTSEPKDVLGLYSWPFFIALLVYAAGFILWGMFLFHPKGLDRFKATIAYIQSRAWLGIVIMLVFVALIASMYILGERWIQFPLLQIAVLLMIVLFTPVILFANPAGGKVQRWRKAVIGILAVIVLAEVLLQIGALLRISPIQNLNGLFTPYGRVYIPDEGGSSGQTNANGWYYPDFRLKDGSERYVLVGGSYLMGLQVAPNQNMGVALDRLMNTDKENPREVMSMGTPDYGLEVYLHPRIYPFTAGTVQPQEVIVVLHPLNDFVVPGTPDGIIPFPELQSGGTIDVPEEEYILRHDLWHKVIRGYDPPNPAQTLQSHLFIGNLMARWLNQATGSLDYVPMGYSNSAQVSEEQPFAGLEFLFQIEGNDPRSQELLSLTTAQLESWRAKLEEAGARIRLVILPYYPAAFYSGNGVVEGYDLYAPERALQAYAAEHDIPVLPLGQYWEAVGVSPSNLQALFLRDGIGHFNVQGHQAVAEAIYDCFYADVPVTGSASAAVGCTGS
jgi:hypothetical protein